MFMNDNPGLASCRKKEFLRMTPLRGIRPRQLKQNSPYKFDLLNLYFIINWICNTKSESDLCLFIRNIQISD